MSKRQLHIVGTESSGEVVWHDRKTDEFWVDGTTPEDNKPLTNEELEAIRAVDD